MLALYDCGNFPNLTPTQLLELPFKCQNRKKKKKEKRRTKFHYIINVIESDNRLLSILKPRRYRALLEKET